MSTPSLKPENAEIVNSFDAAIKNLVTAAGMNGAFLMLVSRGEKNFTTKEVTETGLQSAVVDLLLNLDRCFNIVRKEEQERAAKIVEQTSGYTDEPSPSLADIAARVRNPQTKFR